MKNGRDFIEEVCTMIRTGASYKVIDNYIENAYRNFEITSRVYELCVSMVIDNYNG